MTRHSGRGEADAKPGRGQGCVGVLRERSDTVLEEGTTLPMRIGPPSILSAVLLLVWQKTCKWLFALVPICGYNHRYSLYCTNQILNRVLKSCLGIHVDQAERSYATYRDELACLADKHAPPAAKRCRGAGITFVISPNVKGGQLDRVVHS
jgi:hypothetical protein